MMKSYNKPVDSMARYPDELDTHETTAIDRRVLAALGPRTTEMSRQRSLGAHPYNVTVRHTSVTRELLGHGPLLAPEQTTIVDDDRAQP
jgi:hypothetical protein